LLFLRIALPCLTSCSQTRAESPGPVLLEQLLSIEILLAAITRHQHLLLHLRRLRRPLPLTRRLGLAQLLLHVSDRLLESLDLGLARLDGGPARCMLPAKLFIRLLQAQQLTLHGLHRVLELLAPRALGVKLSGHLVGSLLRSADLSKVLTLDELPLHGSLTLGQRFLTGLLRHFTPMRRQASFLHLVTAGKYQHTLAFLHNGASPDTL
jgi:hypothetical protein